MSDARPSKANLAMLALGGIAFSAAWITAHVFWFFFSAMGGTMMNDYGSATEDQRNLFWVCLLTGQGIAALAGIPAVIAFFSPRHRKRLVTAFIALFLIGALLQAAVYFLMNSVSFPHSPP